MSPSSTVRWRRALRVRVGDDGGREQRLGVGMLGAAEELRARCQLDELAEVHHRDAVAEELDRSEVVRDEQAAEAHVALEVAQEIEDRCLHRHVERRHGLVRDQDAGLEDQRACEADTLALPARELVRVAVAQFGPQPDRVEDPVDARAQLASLRDPVYPQRLADDVAAAHLRVERRVRVLEHHVQLAAQRPHLPPREVRDVHAAQADLAGGRLRQSHHAVRDRRLAAARLADEPEQLAVLQHERDVVDRVHDRSAACDPAADAILLDEVANLEGVRAHGRRSFRPRVEAGDEMVRAHVAKLRHARARELVCPRTAVGEGAHRRQLAQRRHPTGDLTQPRALVVLAVPFERQRDRAQQADRVRVLRLRVEVARPAPPPPCARRTSRARGLRCRRPLRDCG